MRKSWRIAAGEHNVNLLGFCGCKTIVSQPMARRWQRKARGSARKEGARPHRVRTRWARLRRVWQGRSARWRWKRGWITLACASLVASAAALLALWVAIHRVKWLGPWCADTARTLIGSAAVSRLEDWAYDADDRWNRWWRRGEAPHAHWTIPDSPVAPGSGDDADRERTENDGVPVFVPRDVGPLFSDVAAKGDGRWLPIADFGEKGEPVVVFKTLLHPDKERPFAEVFVIAVDLRRTRLRAVAGTVEPESSTAEGRSYTRTGLIPEEHRSSLVVAFNGGFKAEHGQYGMKVDGVTLLPPRDPACTIAGRGDGRVAVAAWAAIAASGDVWAWWRQTPACMVEGGELHPALKSDRATSWGTAVEGGTVVRRSAIGLDESGDVLFACVSNATNARALARAMRHAGATQVAQLDINWSYPHIVTFRASKSGAAEGALLFDGFTYEEGTYLTRRSRRDFFYVTRETKGEPAAGPGSADDVREK